MLGLPRYVVHGAGGGGNAPSLNFNFVDGSAFSPQITFTRASTATFFDSAGVLQSAAIDEPRIDYNPATLAARGLLIEEQRTNSIRNNTMQGAVAGTPGTNPTNWTGDLGGGQGLSPQITDVSTVNGIATIRYQTFGTTTSTGAGALLCEAVNQIAASPGQTWTGSYYLALVGGSIANLNSFSISLRENDSGGNFLRQTLVSASAISSTLARFTVTATLGASTAFVTLAIRAEQPTSTVIDYTLRIGLPQLELGAFATSVIPTTTTALTRSADVASVNTLSPWFNATEGTLYTETLATRQIATAGTGLAMFDDTTINNNIRSFVGSSGAARVVVAASGSTSADLFPGSAISANVVLKLANAYATNDFAAVSNASAVVTDTLGAVPTVSIFRLGFDFVTGVYLNGYLRRIVYYPRRLSNAQLQQITT